VSGLAQRLRERRPRVHCITNTVTQQRVADALAAVGALPIMASADEEVAEVVDAADALLLNMGTPDQARWRAALLAGARAGRKGIPVVLDPVGAGVSGWRGGQLRQLVRAVQPAVIRGNAVEIADLAGLKVEGLGRRGLAVQGTPGDLRSLGRQAAEALRTTVLVTGPRAVVAKADAHWESELAPDSLAGLVGAGDVLSALVAASSAVGGDPSADAQAAVELFHAAAATASANSSGPGTFWPALMDQLGAAS
jgi:hydroxyethylthiazole kinase